jgi:hypothetical protein
MRLLVGLAAGLLAVCALAPAPVAAAEKPCLQIGQVYDFTPVPGNRSLIVTDRLRKKYKLTFTGICSDLQYNMGLGFKSFGTGRLSCLTRGDYVISHDPARPLNHCVIQKIEAYTPQMQKADAAARAAHNR